VVCSSDHGVQLLTQAKGRGSNVGEATSFRHRHSKSPAPSCEALPHLQNPVRVGEVLGAGRNCCGEQDSALDGLQNTCTHLHLHLFPTCPSPCTTPLPAPITAAVPISSPALIPGPLPASAPLRLLAPVSLYLFPHLNHIGFGICQ
jgi:hypothetical protein